MSWREILKAETVNQYTKASKARQPDTSEALVYQIPEVEIKNEYGLPPLSVEDRWAIGHWLSTIREHEPEHREIVRQQCLTDPRARTWYLLKSEKMPKEKRRTCHQCRRWRDGECTSQRPDNSRDQPPHELGKCLDFFPWGGDPDTRQGMARWPELLL